MKTTKFNSYLLDNTKSVEFDDEVLEFWGDRARIQLSCMNEIAAQEVS